MLEIYCYIYTYTNKCVCFSDENGVKFFYTRLTTVEPNDVHHEPHLHSPLNENLPMQSKFRLTKKSG